MLKIYAQKKFQKIPQKYGQFKSPKDTKKMYSQKIEYALDTIFSRKKSDKFQRIPENTEQYTFQKIPRKNNTAKMVTTKKGCLSYRCPWHYLLPHHWVSLEHFSPTFSSSAKTKNKDKDKDKYKGKDKDNWHYLLPHHWVSLEHFSPPSHHLQRQKTKTNTKTNTTDTIFSRTIECLSTSPTFPNPPSHHLTNIFCNLRSIHFKIWDKSICNFDKPCFSFFSSFTDTKDHTVHQLQMKTLCSIYQPLFDSQPKFLTPCHHHIHQHKTFSL